MFLYRFYYEGKNQVEEYPMRCLIRRAENVYPKIGARNQIVGEVIDIKKGAMMAMVKVKIPAESYHGLSHYY